MSMGKFAIFTISVILGVVGMLLLSNQTNKPANQNLSLLPTWTPAPTQNVSPSTPQPTGSGTPSKSPTPTKSEEVGTTVVIKTSKGDIAISLFQKEAPNTVKNFTQKAKSGFYDNLTFHRVEDWVVQGGDPLGNGTGGGKMATELNDKPFVIGSVGVARGGDIEVSNDAQFFITKKDASWLNKQYTNFGMVTKGMDVAQKLQIGDKILSVTIE